MRRFFFFSNYENKHFFENFPDDNSKEKQTASSRIWTQVTDSISYADKHYTKCTSIFVLCTSKCLHMQIFTKFKKNKKTGKIIFPFEISRTNFSENFPDNKLEEKIFS